MDRTVKCCRLCLEQDGNIHIFNNDVLKQKISSCLSFEMMEEEGMPSLICKHCLQCIELFYTFKQKCVAANTRLLQDRKNKAVERTSLAKIEEDKAVDELVRLESNHCTDYESLFNNSFEQNENSTHNAFLHTPSRESFIMKSECKMTPQHISFSPVLTCNLCSKVFSKQVYLDRHILLHSRERNFICKYCSNAYLRARDLARHIRTTHKVDGTPPVMESEPNQDEFSCTMCSRSFTREFYLKQHLIAHSEGQKSGGILCEQCGKSFPSSGALSQHQVSHRTDKAYGCHVCGKTFASISRLNEHLPLHSGAKSYLCNICGKKFSTKAGLQGHTRSHNGEKPYICTLCNKQFTLLPSLKTHMKHHTERKTFACAKCGKRFFTKSGLQYHELVHAGKKAFQCDVCSAAFYSKRQIITHNRYHKGEKRFSCDMCDKRYYEADHLRIHQRTHTGERPFACNLCEKTFIEKSKLKRHMRVHNK